MWLGLEVVGPHWRGIWTVMVVLIASLCLESQVSISRVAALRGRGILMHIGSIRRHAARNRSPRLSQVELLHASGDDAYGTVFRVAPELVQS